MKPNHIPESQRKQYNYHTFIKYLMKNANVSKEYASAAYQSTTKSDYPLTEALLYMKEYL